MTPAEQTDVLVIGGGILGCVTAYHLARERVETLLVESGEINREASGTNAGSLHFQILRQPDYSPGRLAHIRHSVQLHAEAARLWRTLEQDLGCDLGVRLGGGLMVAETPEQFEALKEKSRIERLMGLPTEVVSTREMLELLPHLAADLPGADYCADEGFANPLLVAPAYARQAIAAGARIRIRAEVQAIEPLRVGGFEVQTSDGTIKAKRIVNAAGAGAGQVASLVGLPLPIVGWVLHVNVTEPWPDLLDGKLVQHVGRRLTLKQTQYGTFIVGGGWRGRLDRVTGRKETLWESLIGNTWVAARILPALRDVRVIRTWGGMIATTPDRTPIIGEYPRVKGFYVLYAGAGFTLGPVVGRLMAELLTTGKTSLPIDAYDPERYAVASAASA